MKSLRDSKGLYWGLIVTFFILYACVGFVSTLHSITFFELANTMGLAVLLGITYEIGQATVLFSILTSKNSSNLLPWTLMVLLTALQVTANVYASFKFMDASGSLDWTYWQRSILFWLEADGPEMFKVIISWISGALLPIVALGMVALVAENLKIKDDTDLDIPIKPQTSKTETSIEDLEEKVDKVIYDTPTTTPSEKEQLISFQNNIIMGDETLHEKTAKPNDAGIITEKEPIEIDLGPSKKDVMTTFANTLEYDIESIPVIKKDNDNKLDMSVKSEDIITNELTGDVNILNPKIKGKLIVTNQTDTKKLPLVRGRGWHLKKEYIDSNGDVYNYGEFLQDSATPLKKV